MTLSRPHVSLPLLQCRPLTTITTVFPVITTTSLIASRSIALHTGGDLLQLPPNGPTYSVHSTEGDMVVYREVGEAGLLSPKDRADAAQACVAQPPIANSGSRVKLCSVPPCYTWTARLYR